MNEPAQRAAADVDDSTAHFVGSINFALLFQPRAYALGFTFSPASQVSHRLFLHRLVGEGKSFAAWAGVDSRDE